MYTRRTKFVIFLAIPLVLLAPTSYGQVYVLLGDLINLIINLTRIQSYVFPLYPNFGLAGESIFGKFD
ncbi:unnamed protein product [Phyllotreta striolata]|uniref:Uncharacterized protein n=1 Tax=Phyllotreta striolata TaxID=444603 RepID=A0A9N9TXB5_PHYSR|nr:unnamed protein product [Phyllotreta striolata]